jgi:hypothetical protein
VGHAACMRRPCVHNFDLKPQKMNSFWISRRRREYNIKLDLKKTWCEEIDWIHLRVHERDLHQISVNCSERS